MDAELKVKMLEHLETLENAVEVGKDFATDQAPLTVQEYLTYTIATNSFSLGLGVIGAVLFAYIANRCVKAYRECDPFEGDGYGFGVAGASIGSGVCVIVVCCCLDQLLKASLAPRYFILEEIARLLK